MKMPCAERKSTEKEEYLGKDSKFTLRYVENEVSVGYQDRAALQAVREKEISGEVWSEDKNL